MVTREERGGQRYNREVGLEINLVTSPSGYPDLGEADLRFCGGDMVRVGNDQKSGSEMKSGRK